MRGSFEQDQQSAFWYEIDSSNVLVSISFDVYMWIFRACKEVQHIEMPVPPLDGDEYWRYGFLLVDYQDFMFCADRQACCSKALRLYT